jgi:hypothetical protein
VWETADPTGRCVVLTADRWLHICVEHPELAAFRDFMLIAVEKPFARIPGRRSTEEWYYARGFGPSRYVKVVVHYEQHVGAIWTSFPRRRFP